MSLQPMMVVKAQEKDPGTVKYRGLAVSHVVAVAMYAAKALQGVVNHNQPEKATRKKWTYQTKKMKLSRRTMWSSAAPRQFPISW